MPGSELPLRLHRCHTTNGAAGCTCPSGGQALISSVCSTGWALLPDGYASSAVLKQDGSSAEHRPWPQQGPGYMARVARGPTGCMAQFAYGPHLCQCLCSAIARVRSRVQTPCIGKTCPADADVQLGHQGSAVCGWGPGLVASSLDPTKCIGAFCALLHRNSLDILCISSALRIVPLTPNAPRSTQLLGT